MASNPSAFPALNFIVPGDLEAKHVHRLGETQGMSLRDYFAAHALVGILSNQGLLFRVDEESPEPTRTAAAVYAYAVADAMLEEREKK